MHRYGEDPWTPSWHSHQCPSCHHVWSHHDENKGSDQAHVCPKCGQPWWKQISELTLPLDRLEYGK